MTKNRLPLLGLSILLVLHASCRKDPDDPANWECKDNAACGEKQVCSKKTHRCLDVGCVSSEDCGLSHFCDTRAYRCVEGCRSDDDCEAGTSCNTVAGSCTPYGCRSTQLDCGYGEFCNEQAGECYKPTRDYCESCDASRQTTCGSGTLCIYYQGDRPQDGWCIVLCDPNAADACPRGFECVSDGGTSYCQGDCEWILANGYM